MGQNLSVTPPEAGELELAIASSADPETARFSLTRLRESADRLGVALPDAERLATLVPLLACAAPASRVAAEPRLTWWLTRPRTLDEEKPVAVFQRELRARTCTLDDGAALDRVLRRYRHRELARIALRDLTRRASLHTVVREVSHLADALLQSTIAFWDGRLAARFGERLGSAFCVVAMGKLGAEELNYSSDIDVLFVFDADVRTPSGAFRRDHAIALAQAVIRSLSAVTAHGFAFRVDANLRPYGRDGALAQTVEEMERYYERSGQTWERAALIKARPCAGGEALGEDLIGRLRPFVYRRALDMDAVEALAAMKGRIDREQAHSLTDNVKLGYGGIREIEFFVQALQLLHGGRQQSVRVRSTLGALEALLYAGHIAARDQAALSEAYVFLRDTEHRLQLPEDRQTQALPALDELGSWRALARRMGFTAAGPFEEALARHRRAVHERFVGLLHVAANERVPRREVESALDPQATAEERRSALSALGFQEPEAALGELRRLGRIPESVMGPRGRERHATLAARLLEELAHSPDPDLALTQFAGLFSPQWQPAATTELLASNPATARLLIMLFASSESLTRDLQLHPELLDLLVHADGASETPSRETLAASLREKVGKTDPEERLAGLRRFRRDETLRLALMDLSNRLRPAALAARLSDLAEVVLAEVYDVARAEVCERYGEPEEALFAVLALGSFGGQELDYESDLDIVFVYDAEGPTSGGARGIVESGEWAARLSQRLLNHLTVPGAEGILYRVDARLRPSGTQGQLVTSLRAFAEYHGVYDAAPVRGAALWERQALLRARPIAGDPPLCQAIVARVLEPVARQAMPADAGAQIADMRARLDVSASGPVLYPKKGPGGLLDVEFLTQFLEIQYSVRIPSTRRALETLLEQGWVPADDALELARSYERLRRVESRLRLRYWRPDVFVPASGPVLDRLARQLGDAGAEAGPRLWRDLTRTMARTREIFLQTVK